MRKIDLEILKSYVLILLIISSLFLMGNLWSIETRGAFFNLENNSIVTGLFSWLATGHGDIGSGKYTNFFKPESIVLNMGYDHWKLSMFSTADSKLYDSLWEKTGMDILKGLFKSRTSYSYEGVVPEERWNELLQKKSILYDFVTQYDSSIIKWLAGQEGSKAQVPFPGIRQMILAPYEDAEDYVTVLYIKESNNRIHKFIINNRSYDKAFFDEIIGRITAEKQIKYRIIYDLNLPEPISKKISPHISVPAPDADIADTKIEFRGVEFTDRFNFDKNKNDDIKSLKTYFLGKEKDDFNIHISAGGDNVSFIHVNNDRIFQIQRDGLVEYFNNSKDIDADKEGLADSYKAAVDFLYTYEPYSYEPANEEYKLYLSSIRVDRDIVEFNFDYSFDEIPVVTNYKNGKLKSAVKIEVKGGKVESYYSWFKKGQAGSKKSIPVYEFYDKFATFFDSKSNKDKEIYIDRVFLGYDSSERYVTYPFWYFKAGNDEVAGRVDLLK